MARLAAHGAKPPSGSQRGGRTAMDDADRRAPGQGGGPAAPSGDEQLGSPAGEGGPRAVEPIGLESNNGTIVSGGAEAAQAYIGPTLVPANEHTLVQTQRVKVNLRHADVTVKKGAAKGGAE